MISLYICLTKYHSSQPLMSSWTENFGESWNLLLLEKTSSIEQSEKTTPNDWMIIYFNGVYVPSRCLHVVQRTGVSGRPGQSGGTSVLLFFLLPWVCYQYTADREKVSGKQVQPLCDDRECLRKGYWFYSRFTFHKFSNCEKYKSAHRQIPWQTASEKAVCQEVQHLG